MTDELTPEDIIVALLKRYHTATGWEEKEQYHWWAKELLAQLAKVKKVDRPDKEELEAHIDTILIDLLNEVKDRPTREDWMVTLLRTLGRTKHIVSLIEGEIAPRLLALEKHYESRILNYEAAVEQAKKDEEESVRSILEYIEDMFPELYSGYWQSKGWKDFKKEQTLKSGG